MTRAFMGPDLSRLYEDHRRAVFGVCYRMTGSAADAEDLVQETFRRAIERPPADVSLPIRPWLVRVATNLSIDALRKRKREGYFGPWLPTPVETRELDEPLELGPDARYELAESASIAFLLALEVLEPKQRAALLLRDVLGATGAEAAEILEESPGNVRVLLHRARKALESYDAARQPIDAALKARTGALLRQMVVAFAANQSALLKELIADDVVCVNDGGGEFVAAVVPLRGRARVMEFFSMIAPQEPFPEWFIERDVNGLPAFVVQFPHLEGRERYARRALVTIDLTREGTVRRIYGVVSTKKLVAMRFPA